MNNLIHQQIKNKKKDKQAPIRQVATLKDSEQQVSHRKKAEPIERREKVEDPEEKTLGLMVSRVTEGEDAADDMGEVQVE